MKTVGLITEYNPFHNGHQYHIEEAKRLTGADYAIVVMSGDFVQRGTPAVIDKYKRTRMALQGGADLVLELPVCYATGSAEFFALGAVSLLDKLGITDYLCFGSESGEISLLQDTVQILKNAPVSFSEDLQGFLRGGYTYPAARANALKRLAQTLPSVDSQAISEVITQPNNILAIEYMKALNSISSPIIPVTIKRIAAQYHDTDLSAKPAGSSLSSAEGLYDGKRLVQKAISSATSIRRVIQTQSKISSNYFEMLQHSVPEHVYQILSEEYGKTYPITEEDFSQIIKYKLLAEDKTVLTEYMDISSDLADRMKNLPDYSVNLGELTARIKTRNMTFTRINRALIHLLLNIRTEDMNAFSSNGYIFYARILGIKKEATQLIRTIKKSSTLPLITKVSNASKQLDSLGMRMLSQDIFASHLYQQAICEKYHTILLNEYRQGIILA